MNIFFDIDGTLTVETKGFGNNVFLNRTPRHDVIKKLNKLFDDGHRITLWTSRYDEDEEVTKLWLINNDVKYHKLIMGKPMFDCYICDRSHNVEKLDEVINLSQNG
jgi:uncharacterized HAD superfamily protein